MAEDTKTVEQNLEDMLAKITSLENENNSLKGKMVELADTKDLLTQQTEELNSLKEKVGKSAQQNSSDDAPASIAYIHKEMPELASALDYLIDKKAGKLIADKLKNVEDKLSSFEKSSLTTSTKDYYNLLNASVPEWEQINNDPKFKTFLTVREKYTGKTRMELLKEAHGNMDVSTVSNFFKDFIAIGNESNKENLIGLPSTGDNFDWSAADDNKGVSQDFITKFYQDKTHGKYKGKEAEAQKIEAKINKAVSMGKVF